MSDDFDDIEQIFFEECSESLLSAEAALTEYTEDPSNTEALGAMFRAVHSIKGGSGAFGHERLCSFAHHFENVLDDLRGGKLDLTDSISGDLFTAFDILSDHVEAARSGGTPPEDAEMQARLEAIRNGDSAAAPAAVAETPIAQAPAAEDEDEFGFAPVAMDLDDFSDAELPSLDLDESENDDYPWIVTFRPAASALANGGEPMLVVRELTLLGGEVVSAECDALPDWEAFDPNASYMHWTIRIPAHIDEAELREIFDFLGGDNEINICREGDEADTQASEESASVADMAKVKAAQPASEAPVPVEPEEPVSAQDIMAAPLVKPESAKPDAPKADKKSSQAQTVRIDVTKLDLLLNLVGELVIRNSILADRLSPQDCERVELPQFSRLIREVQDTVMALRAQPLRSSFSRIPRLMRDLIAETGKAARLEVTGEHIEVDKSVIERIGDPLTHMIRNALDHGIESADKRREAGKSVEGLITVSAEQRGARIFITVKDDGGGINRARVRKLAEERGLVAADAELTDNEIDQLICTPGFSTAESISNISGRGVGMDVVRSNIEALGGRIDISSVPGKGTSMSMMLPLTLAIMEGMIVRIAGQRYVIPLSNVIETVQPEKGQMRRVTVDTEVLDLRGNYVPVSHAAKSLGIAANDPGDVTDNLVIVVENGLGEHAGLVVDTIEDRREVVIKSLEQHLYPIDGLAGATILGDGSIAYILDIEQLASAQAQAVKKNKKGMAA